MKKYKYEGAEDFLDSEQFKNFKNDFIYNTPFRIIRHVFSVAREVIEEPEDPPVVAKIPNQAELLHRGKSIANHQHVTTLSGDDSFPDQIVWGTSGTVDISVQVTASLIQQIAEYAKEQKTDFNTTLVLFLHRGIENTKNPGTLCVWCPECKACISEDSWSFDDNEYHHVKCPWCHKIFLLQIIKQWGDKFFRVKKVKVSGNVEEQTE